MSSDECLRPVEGGISDDDLLDQAIAHALEKAVELLGTPCGKEHEQLAEWLNELYLRRTGETSPAWVKHYD